MCIYVGMGVSSVTSFGVEGPRPLQRACPLIDALGQCNRPTLRNIPMGWQQQDLLGKLLAGGKPALRHQMADTVIKVGASIKALAEQMLVQCARVFAKQWVRRGDKPINVV